MRRRSILSGVLVALLFVGWVATPAAQGSFSAQIQAALQLFLQQAHTWTQTQTFQNIVVNGSCTGCGGGGGGTISGTIADTQVAFGTGADTIGGSANITWDGQDLGVFGTPRGIWAAANSAYSTSYAGVSYDGIVYSQIADESTRNFEAYNLTYDGSTFMRTMDNGDFHVDLPNVASTFQLGGRLGINDLTGQGGNAINYADKFVVDSGGNTAGSGFAGVKDGLTSFGLLNDWYGANPAPFVAQYDGNARWGIIQLAGGNTSDGVINEFVKSRTTNGSGYVTAQSGDKVFTFDGLVDNGTVLTSAGFVRLVTTAAPSTAYTASQWVISGSDGSSAIELMTLAPSVTTVASLKTTGAATGKTVVCVDTATGQLYASSTGTDCSN